MKLSGSSVLVVYAASLGVLLGSQAVPVGGEETPLHKVVVLPMHFDAPKDRTAAAFGPLAEAKWATDFRPRFVYPQPAAQMSGAVFKTQNGKLWLLHDFDPAAGLVQYVIVDPASEATTLTIRATADTGGSAITMTYDMVGIDDAGRAHVATIEKHAHELAEHIQDAVKTYLASGGTPSAG